jgi:hypothetical protein
MIIDRYTKAVLTVIAGCLLWMCAMSLAPVASAQMAGMRGIPNASVQPVVIVGTGTLDQHGSVSIEFERTSTGPKTNPTIPVSAPKPLAVELPYTRSNPMPSELSYTPASPLAVEIAAVRKTGEWEPLRARVEDAATRPRPGGGRP